MSGSVETPSLTEGTSTCEFTPSGLGWRRDIPDHRDFGVDHETLVAMLMGLKGREVTDEPATVKLDTYWPPVDDQLSLATSSVHTCLAVVRYMERRASGEQIEPSRLFLYKTARRLSFLVADAGVPLRATLKAIARFGLPPEHQWPYEPSRFDRELDPTLFCYGQDFRAMRYARLDPPAISGATVLERVKELLRCGFPVVFGFPVHSSITRQAWISWPRADDWLRGGQAVVAMGYDDEMRQDGHSGKGGLMIRNCWGEAWGDGGYGYLPYRYVTSRLACDFWTVFKADWLEQGDFQQPTWPE